MPMWEPVLWAVLYVPGSAGHAALMARQLSVGMVVENDKCSTVYQGKLVLLPVFAGNHPPA